MLQPPYPLRPEPFKRSWVEQHPRWKIPLGCSIIILGIAVFACVVMAAVLTSFRNSDVYRQAADQANRNPQVRAQLGERLKVGWFVSGELKVNGNTGNANLSIPISGPHGKGTIRAVASKSGIWRFSCLEVHINGQPGAIDLLSVE